MRQNYYKSRHFIRRSTPFLLTLIFALPSYQPLAAEKAAQAQTSDRHGKFRNRSEAGVVIVGGNVVTTTISLKSEASYNWNNNEIGLNGRMVFSSFAGSLAGRAWSLGAQYEREFSEKFNAVIGEKFEGNTFAGFDYRASTDLGAKYFLSRHGESFLFTEFGYRFTFENRIPTAETPTQSSNFVRLYVEGQREFTQSFRGRLWVEVLPDLTHSQNLLINFEPSIESLLSNVFSLKVSLLGKFDNEPALSSNKKIDYTYTTSLVASF